MTPALLAVLLVVILAFVGMAPNATAQEPNVASKWSTLHAVTNDVRTEHYIDGQLGWQDSGVVLWEGESADDGTLEAAPLHPASEVTTWAGWTLDASTGGAYGEDLIPKVRFESSPFPEDIYVDVGRVMQVNVMVQVSSCGRAMNQFSLEARIDGEIWGGMPRGLMQQVVEASTDPKPPAGWCLLKFRFHSEMDVIEAGDVVELTIFYHHNSLADSAQAPTIGFGPDHPSTIHVPFYPLDEAALRRPEFQEGSQAAPVLAGLGGGAALAFLLVPKGRRRGLLALLIVAPMLAGCSSGGGGVPESVDDEPSGSQEYTIEEGDPGSTVNGTGMIVGLVRDIRSIPVSGAHVAMLGTDFSGTTDKRGKFVFDGLGEGSYTYRIDHKLHRSFEAEVEVQSGSVTRLDVLLQHKDNRTGDALAHRHSMFPPSGQKVLFDEPIAEDVVCTYANDGLFLSARTHCVLAFALPLAPPGEDPLLVYPGTQKLEITISWDGGTAQDAGIFFIPNGEPFEGSYDRINHTVMWPRQSGETTTIQVPWELADIGHQHWSVWQFGVWIPVEAGGNAGSLPEARTVTLDGPLHVKIEAFKGVVPLEPPHKDLWKGEDSLVVVDGVSDTFRMVPSRIPFETNWLEITLERDRETLGTNEKLVYEAADSPSGIRSKEREVVFPEDGLKQSVKWPLLPGEPDPPYAKSTSWEFNFHRPSLQEDPQVQLASADEAARGQVMYTLTVVAHRTEVPTDAAERSD